jgi:hypothetical protein
MFRGKRQQSSRELRISSRDVYPYVCEYCRWRIVEGLQCDRSSANRRKRERRRERTLVSEILIPVFRGERNAANPEFLGLRRLRASGGDAKGKSSKQIPRSRAVRVPEPGKLESLPKQIFLDEEILSGINAKCNL